MTGKIRDIASAGKDLRVVCLLTAIWNEITECLEMVCHDSDVECESETENNQVAIGFKVLKVLGSS